jgi:hypothetical protein
MEASYRQAVIDRVFSQTHSEQLLASHHSMLPPRQLSDLGICTARPSQPVYFAG